MVDAALEVRGLSHTFAGSPSVGVLEGIDLDAAPGQFVSIVGPSGGGKSTLLRVLAGLLVPTAGAAAVQGRSTIATPGLAAYMPQRDLLLPWRRALDNALLGARVRGELAAETRLRGEEWFARFGLGAFERSWPSQLSGGMRQRVALLRTFLMDLEVVLLDEPFGALDAITRRDMHQWLQTLWLEERRTVLLVTHDVDEALFLSDVVHVLSSRPGRLVASFATGFAHPRDRHLLTDPDFVRRKAEVLDALDAAR